MYLFLAGAETFHDLMMTHEAPFRLYTYYTLRNDKRLRAKLGDLRRLKQEKPWTRIFLDSGAFSIVADAYQGRGKNVDLHEYGDGYCDFVEEYGDLFDIIAELDIEATGRIHRDYVWKWYDRLWAACGAKLIYVWHPHRGIEEYAAMLRETEHRWIGIAANTAAQFGTGKVMRMIGEARRAAKHVHGFGQTRIQTDLKFTRWTSADSSTWLAGDKYGATFVFRGGKLTRLSSFEDKATRARQRKLLRRYFEKIGVDPKRIENDEVEEVRKSSMIAWILFARRLYEAGKRRGYHLIWNEPPWAPETTYEEDAVSNSPAPKKRLKLPKGSKLRLKKRKSTKMDTSGQEMPNNSEERDMGHSQSPQIGALPASPLEAFMKGNSRTAKEREPDSFYAILGRLTAPDVMSREDIKATAEETTTMHALSVADEQQGESPSLENAPTTEGEEIEIETVEGAIDQPTEDRAQQGGGGPRSHAQSSRENRALAVVEGNDDQSHKPTLPVISSGAAIGAAMRALPRLACSTCAISDDCPEFRDGYLCAFNDLFAGLSTRRADNVVPLMQSLVDANVERTMLAVLQERLVAGGQLDSRVSAQLNQALQQLQMVDRMNRANDPRGVSVRVSEAGGRMSASMEGPSQPGFLARLFGGGAPTPTDSVQINEPTQGPDIGGHPAVEAQPTVIDAHAEPVPASVPDKTEE